MARPKTFIVRLAYETYEIINDTLAGQVRYEEATGYNEDTQKCEITAELPSKKCVTLRVGLDETTDDVSARITLDDKDGNIIATLWDDTYLPWKISGDTRELTLPFESDGQQYNVCYQTKVGQKKTVILTASGKPSKGINLYFPEWLN